MKPVEYWDVLYVDCPQYNLEDDDDAEKAFPWTGKRPYMLGAVVYMLTRGIITTENLLYGVHASRRIEGQVLGRCFDSIKDIVRDVMRTEQQENPELHDGEIAQIVKRSVLSVIGMWNITDRSIGKVYNTNFQEDCPETATRRTYEGNGRWSHMAQVELLDTRSMRAFGQIALDWEHCLCDMMRRGLAELPSVRRLGMHVDGLFYVYMGTRPGNEEVDQHIPCTLR